MWNESNFLKVFVDVRRKAGGRILIPIIVCLQCLSSYIEDIADLCAMLPQRIRISSDRDKDMTLGQATAMMRAAVAIFRDMKGFKLNVKAREGDGDSVRVNIKAF